MGSHNLYFFPVLGCILALAACSSTPVENNLVEIESTTEMSSVSESPTPTYTTQAAAPITTTQAQATMTDTGYNLEWSIRKVTYGDDGGVVFYFNVKNLSDVPLPPELLPEPTLSIINSGGISSTVEPISDTTTTSATAEPTTDQLTQPSPVRLSPGLDVPLGAGATTTVVYSFNTTVASLSRASLTVGNITWTGNLNVQARS